MTHNEAQTPGRAKIALRILLVEDHEDTLYLMTRLLSAAGHEVRSAATKFAALEAANTQSFDCVIADLGLPDGSGLDLMRELIAKAREPIKGIALTGSTEPADVENCQRAGFARHLCKPIDFSVLEKMVWELC